MQHVGARVCQKLSARKVALRAGIQSANAMGCGFTHKAHDADQFGDNEVRRQHSLLAHMVTLGTAHAPHNLASASGQWTLPDGSRAGSLLFHGQSRIAKQKEVSKRETCKMHFLVLETTLTQGSFRFKQVLWEKGRKSLPAHPRMMERHCATMGDGTEICFKFSEGHADACASLCQQGRAHACQWCQEPHRNEQCQTDAAVAARTKGVGKGGGK